MYMVKLTTGAVVFRLDTNPAEGEKIEAFKEVSAAPGEFERFDWDAGEIVPLSAAEVEGQLLAAIDVRRDQEFARMLESSDARSVEYINKAMEAYSNIGPWPYLSALALAKGTTIEDERLAVMEARDTAEAARGAFLAMVLANKKAVRQAASSAEKIAIAKSIAWPNG